MTRATITQCTILVGGLGTRLGTRTANTPKLILPCGDRPFLAWLLREFVRFGVTEFLLLTGHLSVDVEKAAHDIAAALPRDVRITISEEPVRAGTGARSTMPGTGWTNGSCSATATRCLIAMSPICSLLQRKTTNLSPAAWYCGSWLTRRASAW